MPKKKRYHGAGLPCHGSFPGSSVGLGEFPRPFFLILHTRYTWALTFQNVCKKPKKVEFLRFIFFSNFFTGVIIFFTQVYIQIYIYIYIYIHTLSVRMYIYIHYLCVCVCVKVYKHVYNCVYVYTHFFVIST